MPSSITATASPSSSTSRSTRSAGSQGSTPEARPLRSATRAAPFHASTARAPGRSRSGRRNRLQRSLLAALGERVESRTEGVEGERGAGVGRAQLFQHERACEGAESRAAERLGPLERGEPDLGEGVARGDVDAPRRLEVAVVRAQLLLREAPRGIAQQLQFGVESEVDHRVATRSRRGLRGANRRCPSRNGRSCSTR